MVSRLDRNFYQKTKFLKTMAVCLHNKKSRGSSSEPRLSVNTTLLPHRAHLPGATVSSLDFTNWVGLNRVARRGG